MADKSETPLLDELEKGKWPSFVKEMKRAAEKKPMAKDLLRQLELSYRERSALETWGDRRGEGLRGGVIGRYSDRPDLFPHVQAFHTLRVNHPTGWFYRTDALRRLCDVWDKHGSGLTNMHGSTGDVILLGTTTEHLQPCFDDLSDAGFDLGGSGSALRTPSACVGPARCEWACIDSLDICYQTTMEFQDEIHRPMFPYKFKIKVSACPNDCVAAIARADLAVIGTWKGDIQVDQDEVKAYADAGLNIQREVCDLCPTRCMEWDGKKLKIYNRGLYALHALHQSDAESSAAGQGKRRDHPDRRQSAHFARGSSFLGHRAVYENGTALLGTQRPDRTHSGLVG